MPYLCLSSDVPPGTWKQVDAFGEGLLVWRDEAGTLGLDRNACPHRGFPMGIGAGSLPLKCKYHGLPFQPRNELWIGEAFGAVWSAVPKLGGTESDIIRLAATGKEFQRIEHPVEAPWFLWMANAMDPNHVATTHPEFSKQLEEKARPFDVRITKDKTVSSYRISVRQEIATRWRRLLGAILSADFFHVMVYPYLSVTSFLGVLGSIETVVPLGDEVRGSPCYVTTRYFTAPGIELPAQIIRAATEANRQILEEDRRLCEEWASGNPFVKTKAWLPGEERVLAFVERAKEDGWAPTII